MSVQICSSLSHCRLSILHKKITNQKLPPKHHMCTKNRVPIDPRQHRKTSTVIQTSRLPPSSTFAQFLGSHTPPNCLPPLEPTAYYHTELLSATRVKRSVQQRSGCHFILTFCKLTKPGSRDCSLVWRVKMWKIWGLEKCTKCASWNKLLELIIDRFRSWVNTILGYESGGLVLKSNNLFIKNNML